MKKLTFIATCALGITLLFSCGSNKKDDKNNVPKEDSTTTVENKPGWDMSGTLTLETTEFKPGDEIVLNYTYEGSLGKNAWVGVIPSNVAHGDENKNDQYDIDYQYLNKDMTSGKLTFIAPKDTGNYDFRLNNTDQDGKEIASVSFTVKGEGNTKIDLKTDKKSYSKGEKIKVSFMAPVSWEKKAWIGLVPASTAHNGATENDKVDVAYEYINGRGQGSFEFTAPQESGSWSIRMFDSYSGKESKYVDIKVN